MRNAANSKHSSPCMYAYVEVYLYPRALGCTRAREHLDPGEFHARSRNGCERAAHRYACGLGGACSRARVPICVHDMVLLSRGRGQEGNEKR